MILGPVVYLLSSVQLFATHELQQARLPCPSLSPRVCSNSSPLIQWCHPTISSSGAFFSSCPQFFPASGSFPMSRLFASGGQSICTSASASVLPANIQGWFPLGLTGLISLQSKGLSRVFSFYLVSCFIPSFHSVCASNSWNILGFFRIELSCFSFVIFPV